MSAAARAEAEARARELGHDLDVWREDDTLGGWVTSIFCRRCHCGLVDNAGIPMGTALVLTCAEARRSSSRSLADLG